MAGIDIALRAVGITLCLKRRETAVAIETIGKYQMHLIAREVSAGAKWAPYLQIDKFNDEMQNFECVVERHRVAGHDVFDSEEAAEDIARQFGNALIAARNA